MLRTQFNKMGSYGASDASVFQIEITSADITNSTAFHAFNLTGSTGCKIRWGDTAQTLWTANGLYSHTYASAGTYTVSIHGAHTNFNHYSASALTTPMKVVKALQLYSGLTSCLNMYNGCHNAKFALDSGFSIPAHVTTCYSMFSTCYGTSFNSLPTGFSIPDSVTNTSLMFFNASFLVLLPSSLVIPASVTNPSGMFKYCFGLTADISNIFPSWTAGKSINVSELFRGDSKITGSAPSAKLWDRTDITWTTTSAFQTCTLLSNYASIPTAWK